jgi:hypothetical protein
VAPLGHETVRLVQILFRDEFFNFVDGDRVVNVPPGTLGFAGPGTDTPAHRGEGIFVFNEFKGLGVFSLGREFNVTLYGDMGGTGGFAGARTGIDDIFSRGTVIGIPLFLGPLCVPGRFFPFNRLNHRRF